MQKEMFVDIEKKFSVMSNRLKLTATKGFV